jgi:hypothetical protein
MKVHEGNAVKFTVKNRKEVWLEIGDFMMQVDWNQVRNAVAKAQLKLTQLNYGR